MKCSSLLIAAIALVVIPASAFAKDPEWNKKAPSEWTADDVGDVLGKSPWVANVQVLPTILIAGKQDKPIGSSSRVTVQARWFSSRIIKQAIARNAELNGAKMSDEEKDESTRPDDRFYEILVAADKLDVLDAIPFPELAKSTVLEADGQTFALVTILRPADLKGPQCQMIFRKGKGIPETAKSVSLKTEWNGSKLEFKWDTTKMVWNGSCGEGKKPTHDIVGDPKAEKLTVRDLDGDFCPVYDNEARRREIQAAILGSGDEALDRAISDVRVNRANTTDKFSVYVFYDAKKEATDASEKAGEAGERKLKMSQAIGKWSLANKTPGLKAIVFLKPGASKPDDFIHVSCAEKVSKLSGAEAEKLFKEKLTPPTAATVPVCEDSAKAAIPEATKAASADATPKPAKTARPKTK